MAEELEKTCENCEYENEDMEGTHCRHCIHNATENFEPKTSCNEQEIRNKAIDECIRIIEETVWKDTDMLVDSIREMKGGAE